MNIPASESSRLLRISLPLWWRMHRQLRRRGDGRRESGAFLLGHRGEDAVDRVRSFVCFDDLDSTCLDTGIIEFHSHGFAALWATCRRSSLDVLADVHTHPGRDSSQSETDRRHPMISERGHLAMIVPQFAQQFPFRWSTMSVYEYCGSYRWCDWSRSRRRRVQFTCF